MVGTLYIAGEKALKGLKCLKKADYTPIPGHGFAVHFKTKREALESQKLVTVQGVRTKVVGTLQRVILHGLGTVSA
jgi:hypothetical protein